MIVENVGAVLPPHDGFADFSASSLDLGTDDRNDNLEKFREVMHTILSNLMAALLCIHALLGCCWHHAHRCEQCTPSATQVAQPPKCCHHHQGTDEKQDGKKTPCKCFVECYGVCTFLPSQKTQLDSPEWVVPLDFVANLTTVSDVQQWATSLWEVSRGPTANSQPLRLHLLHQILLI